MKRLLFAAAALLLAAPAFACDYSLGSICAPALRVEYRTVQPQIVSQIYTVERQVLQRDPVIVERSQTKLEYRQAQVAYGAAVVQKQIVVQPVIRARLEVQKAVAPVRVERVEVERRGLFGRRIIKRESVTIK